MTSRGIISKQGRLRPWRHDEVRDRSHGAAGPVRHVNPKGYVPPEPKPSLIVPRSRASVAEEHRALLEDLATKLTRIKPISKRKVP